MKKLRICAIILLAALLLGCGMGLAEENNAPLKLVCTSFPCYDFARAVGGELADVTLLIKPGTEVHTYEPTPADVIKIADCDLFVYIGGESDAWVDSILESFGDAAPARLRLFDCVEALELSEDEEHAHDEGHGHDGAHEYDEHIWTSPVNALGMLEALRSALCALAPDRAYAFTENAQAYMDEVARIDAEIRDIVKNAARTELIFADRFPFLYFAREYDLSYSAAFPSCAAESEPSAKVLMQLIKKVKDEKIPVVYCIELSNGKTGKAIAEETGAKLMTLYSIQNLSEKDFAAGESYVSLMRRNIEALREGLM